MTQQLLSAVAEITGLVSGENPRRIPALNSGALPGAEWSTTMRSSRSLDLVQSLRLLLETELGSSNFGLYNVDEAKGVLWPMLHSSGESILRPVDLMSNHSLRRAVESRFITTFRLPLQLEEFLPAVSAFVPLPGKGRTTRLLVLFDLKHMSSFEGLQQQVLPKVQERASRLLSDFSA